MSSAALPLMDWFSASSDNNVLIVGDTHGAFDWVELVVIPYAVTHNCQTIMQLGDFGFIWDNDVDIVHAALDRLDGALAAADIVLTFLCGNYENHPVLEALAAKAERTPEGHYSLRPHIVYTGRIAVWTWDGLRVAAVGGATSIDRDLRVPGVSWWPEERLTEREVCEALGYGPVDILFTHDAPTCIPMRLVPDVLSMVNRTAMSQVGRALRPALWFHGHYHQSVTYCFEHRTGVTTVRGLGRDYATEVTDSMVALNLGIVLDQLNAGRYGGTEDVQ
jgi:hypothetical protein